MTDIWESSVSAGVFGAVGTVHLLLSLGVGAMGPSKRVYRVGVANAIGHFAACLGMILVFYGVNSELSRWLTQTIFHVLVFYVTARAYSLVVVDAAFAGLLMGGAFFMPFLTGQLLTLEARYFPFIAAVMMFIAGMLTIWVRCDKKYLWSVGIGLVYYVFIGSVGILYGLGYLASPLLYSSWTIETIYTYYFWVNMVSVVLGLSTMFMALIKQYHGPVRDMMKKWKTEQGKVWKSEGRYKKTRENMI